MDGWMDGLMNGWMKDKKHGIKVVTRFYHLYLNVKE